MALTWRVADRRGGLDVDYFRECPIVPDSAQIPSMLKDLRDLSRDDVQGFDAIIHLAALSNDPIGNLNRDWTRDINLTGSVRLAEMAREAGVRRFLFSSSCIMYGLSDAPEVDETSALDPRTDYARSKVEAERAITDSLATGFANVPRNEPCTGCRPGCASTRSSRSGPVPPSHTVASSSGRWQTVAPGCSVEDLAVHCCGARRARPTCHQAFNWVRFYELRVVDLATAVANAVPDSAIEVKARRRPTSVPTGELCEVCANVSVSRVPQPVAGSQGPVRGLCCASVDGRVVSRRSIHSPAAVATPARRRAARSGAAMGYASWNGSESMIDGVKIIPLRQIVDERGKIMHMFEGHGSHFIRFGEIYFSCAPCTITAWHIHIR